MKDSLEKLGFEPQGDSYPIVGVVWVALALLATRVGLRLARQDRAEATAKAATATN